MPRSPARSTASCWQACAGVSSLSSCASGMEKRISTSVSSVGATASLSRNCISTSFAPVLFPGMTHCVSVPRSFSHTRLPSLSKRRRLPSNAMSPTFAPDTSGVTSSTSTFSGPSVSSSSFLSSALKPSRRVALPSFQSSRRRARLRYIVHCALSSSSIGCSKTSFPSREDHFTPASSRLSVPAPSPKSCTDSKIIGCSHGDAHAVRGRQSTVHVRRGAAGAREPQEGRREKSAGKGESTRYLPRTLVVHVPCFTRVADDPETIGNWNESDRARSRKQGQSFTLAFLHTCRCKTFSIRLPGVDSALPAPPAPCPPSPFLSPASPPPHHRAPPPRCQAAAQRSVLNAFRSYPR